MLAIIEPQIGQTLNVAAGATSFTIAAAIFGLMDVRPGDRLCSGSAAMIIRSVDPDSGNGVLLQGWPGLALADAVDWYIEQSQASRQSAVASAEMVATANGWLARVLGQATPWTVRGRLSAPPSSPADGDTYLASATADGGFLPNVIYRRQDAAWVPIRPRIGDIVFVVATREFMGWDGTAWGVTAPPGGSIATAALADAAVTTTKLADAAVSNGKLTDMAAGTIKLRAVGTGNGSPIDGTPAQARAIVQVIDPTPSLIVNGAMQHSQEWGTTVVPVASGSWPYVADQVYVPLGGTGFAASAQRVASATPGGSPYRVRVTITTAKASLAASDLLVVQQPFEGRALSATKFGTASARRLLGSFMFRGPAGTYGWRLTAPSGVRTWIGTFTISAGQANVDTLQTVAIDPDTTGSWDLTSNAFACGFGITLACGSNYFGNIGWNSVERMSTSSQFNGVGSTSNVFEVGDLDLYPDVSGIGAARPFVVPDPVAELLRCQRYYWKYDIPFGYYGGLISTSIARLVSVKFPIAMRIAPTCTYIFATNGAFAGGHPLVDGVSVELVNLRADVTADTAWSRLTSFSATARM